MNQEITVVIPTRERADTLRHCLESIVAQDCDRLTILVSDNASGPATREVIESFDDPRITYVNTGERLSMAHNFEFALSHVSNGWIVLVGDDDGLLPGRLEAAVAEVEESGLKALSAENCFFNWPGAAPGERVRLSIPLGTKSRAIRGREGMEHLLAMYRTRYRLPQTYTGGIVDAGLYNAIKAKKGRFFQSQIPDIFSGFAICSCVEYFLHTERPFAVAGRSGHSIGEALLNLEKSPFLSEGLIPFHSDFPMPELGTLTFSNPAIQFESYVQAAYLHRGTPSFSRQYMLESTLANSAFGREHIYEWGKQFATLHGLDYARAVKDARWNRRRTALVNKVRAAESLLARARLYAADSRALANVREASETADALLRNPPNRLLETVRTLVRR